MKKSDIIHAVAERSGLTKNVSEQILDAYFTVLKAALAEGQDVPLGDLGRLQVKDRPARPGRNPRTGETIEIPARKVVSLKSGKALSDALGTV